MIGRRSACTALPRHLAPALIERRLDHKGNANIFPSASASESIGNYNTIVDTGDFETAFLHVALQSATMNESSSHMKAAGCERGYKPTCCHVSATDFDKCH